MKNELFRFAAFGRRAEPLPFVCSHASFCPSVLPGGLKCPVCSFVYGTKWEFNRHLKNKHGLKLVENEGEPKWEVTFSRTFILEHAIHLDVSQHARRAGMPGYRSRGAAPQSFGFSGWETETAFQIPCHS